MKKLYTLVAMMLVATFCFAQNIPAKVAHQYDGKKMIFKNKIQNSRNEPGSAWIFYPDVTESYWGVEDIMRSYPVQYDTNGLIIPSSGDPWHPNVCGFGMTFDLNSDLYELSGEEGDISWLNTASYNLDSLFIYGGYFRPAATPAGTVDTLIVGVVTTITDDDLMNLSTSTVNPIITFYKVGYDPATGVQQNAVVYKFILDDNMVSQEEGDSYYAAPLQFYMGINNITNKALHIAYTFKRGYELGVNDTIANYSRFVGWVGMDGRGNYCPYQDGWTQFIELGNYNIGGIIDADTRYDIDASPSDWYYRMYYPAPFWSALHYPYIMPKLSCSDCAIIGVEEMEKENISVYPNPATNKFTVNLAGSEKANIEMFNLVGQKVYNSTATEKAEVNVSGFRPGIYMLKVSQNGKVYTSKVVVK